MKSKKEKIIEHHVKYKEIHGKDETIWMTDQEHKKLHYRLRRDKKCNVPPDKLKNISKSAYARTKKGKTILKKYRNSECGKESKRKYNQSNKRKKTQQEYITENIRYLHFSVSPGKNTELYEKIGYNHKTGNIRYSSRFKGTGMYKIPVINI